RPLPSPLTSNVDDADTKVDGSALGKSLESPGSEPDCQSVGKVEMNAVDSPAYTLKFGVRKSVRVGVVVFFARDGVIYPTPAGSGAPVNRSFARSGHVNFFTGPIRDV